MEIIEGVGEGSGLTCVYFSMLMVGVLYALVILIGGSAGDGAGEVDADFGGADFDGGDFGDGGSDLAHLSPVTLAGFVSAFGAFGLIAQGLVNASPIMSLLWATVGGVLVGLVSHVAFVYFFIKPQGSSEVTRRDVIGARGEVITSIPTGRVGEIAFVAQGARVTATARSADGGAVDRGTIVHITDKVGSVVVVAPVTNADAPPGTTSDEA